LASGCPKESETQVSDSDIKRHLYFDQSFNSCSMGVGEFLSSKANNEWILSEKKREEWEMENYREGEIQEMIDIYVEKGMSYDDAKLVIETMAKYDEFFVDVMMQQELELQVPDENHVQESIKEGM
jgi:vacuolar iron transporter family protein